MVEFSIIIPVYNAERTIDRCLQSVLAQQYTDYEVLMIDDGSSDHSSDICKRYAYENSQFYYFFETNAGPSSARNKGLDNAKGNIIIFLDSDDFLEKGALSVLHSCYVSDEVDIVFQSYNKVDEDGNLINHRTIDFIPNNTWEMLQLLSRHDMYGYNCSKSIRKSIIGNIRFREDVNLFEDEIFTCDLINDSITIGYTRYPIINYVVNNKDALTGRIHQDYCVKREYVYQAWNSMAHRLGYSEDDILEIANRSLITCKYYYLERDIDGKSFLEDLRNTTFIRTSNIDPAFCEMVISGNYFRLLMLRNKYRMKAMLSCVVKG